MKKLVVWLLLIGAFGVGAAFSYHNPQPVQINYLVGESMAPLGTLLMAAIAATVLLMGMIYGVIAIARKAEIGRLRRQLQKAESELANLRKLPLKDG